MKIRSLYHAGVLKLSLSETKCKKENNKNEMLRYTEKEQVLLKLNKTNNKHVIYILMHFIIMLRVNKEIIKIFFVILFSFSFHKMGGGEWLCSL